MTDQAVMTDNYTLKLTEKDRPQDTEEHYQLVVPRHRLSSYGQWAFFVAGPAIWNWLSDSLRAPAISRDSFKRSLKTF